MNDVIFPKSWLVFKGYSLSHNNWGDDINKYFLEYAANIKIALTPFKELFFPNTIYYSLIGSWGSANLDDCIIYGTGVGTSSAHFTGIPKKIISVRGPLSRDRYLHSGINCPERYGDIALLLPLFYEPKLCSEGRKFTVIPHHRTLRMGNDIVNNITSEYDCNLISMYEYDEWTDVIDTIAGSSFILSESLHGIIISETYNIPCIWVEFTDHSPDKIIWGAQYDDWSFKFRDFYESIGKHDMKSIKLYEGIDFDVLLEEKRRWRPGKIDYEKLLGYFPFKIKPEHAKEIPSRLRALRERNNARNTRRA